MFLLSTRQIITKLSFIVLSLITSTSLFAQRGKDGIKVISAANSIVNDYTILISNASAGSTTINVANSTLSANGFSSALAPGDLIFIIQMQGASITSPNDATYGTISSYNNCGNNEFAEVSSVPSSTSITLDCGLKNDYTSSGKVQIVRVPRYSTLIINSGGILTSQTWNSSSGGVVAVEVLGTTTINAGGKIDVTGKGFRGGALDNDAQFGTWDFTWNTSISGAEKGESIAGYQADYDAITGRYDRAAAANGGGGGNSHNAGGGGGANAGDINAWNGLGNPDISTANMIAAWNLESPGLASSTSSGGGKGGYSYGPNNGDPTVTAPGSGSWGGDFRRPVGGYGGRPLDYSTGRLFLGGGGGAGDQNESRGTAGTNGGGMVYLVTYSDINGTGSIVANGTDVATTTNSTASDGCGGAGGGGTVVLNAQGTISGVSINANGGKGGNQTIYSFINYRYEAEGPGGGGGGGYIAISNGAPTRTANGGLNGTTNSGAISAKFPSNGATIGGAGLPNQSINNSFLQVSGVDTICSGTSTTLTASTGGTPIPGVTYNWFSSPAGGSPIYTGNAFTTPILNSTTTYYAASCPGTYRLPVQVTVDAVSALFVPTNICVGIPANFNGGASSSTGAPLIYSWNFGDLATSTAQNPSHLYAIPNTYTVSFTATDSVTCSATYTASVIIYAKAQSAFSANVTSGCAPLSVSFTNTTTSANNYTWSFGDAGTSSAVNPSHSYNSPGTYTVQLISSTSGGCNDTLTKTAYIVVNSLPVASFTANNVCLLDTVVLNNTSTGASGYTWKFGDASTSNSPNPTHNYASPGTYTVTLIASSGSCMDSTTQTVVVNPGPTASFSAAPLSACDSLNVTFTNTSSGGITYSWDFGDTYTSNSPNPNHTYNVSGTYSVMLTATAGNCSNVKTLSNIITIYPTPHATVSVPKNLVCINNCTDFTSVPTGSPTSWSWSFPGGSTTASTDTNPSNICYYVVGSYNVSLTVSNAHCSSSQTLTNYIYVDECTPPHASFYSNDTTICNPSCVNFTSTASSIKSYEWHFPGGTPDSSSVANPANICYSTPGTYDVTMIVTNNFSADTLNLTKFIIVANPPSAPTFGQSGDTLISSPATSYQWYYNGMLIANGTNQKYVATQSGSYSVTITDGNGCTATSTTSFINVGLEEFSNNELFSIYPNPFDQTLNLLMKNTFAGNAQLKITDAIGKIVFEKELKVVTQPYILSLDVSDLASGVYSVTLESEKFNVIRKVVKQ